MALVKIIRVIYSPDYDRTLFVLFASKYSSLSFRREILSELQIIRCAQQT